VSEAIFLIDGPYVSDFLKRTIYELQIPVVKTQEAKALLGETQTAYLSEEEAVLKLKKSPDTKIYTNSENSLVWIYTRHPNRELVDKLLSTKDKVLFRKKLERINPDFYYRELSSNEFEKLDPDLIPFPVIVKPAVGFFSLGVHGVQSQGDWRDTIAGIKSTIQQTNELYPAAVLDNTKYIIEEVIDGDEFAIDCYYDNSGTPVVLNIMKHLFASDNDVNDRVYISSGNIVGEYLERITNYLNSLGEIFRLKDFPAHVELRITETGLINVIEINPLRFGGWCSTPDLAKYAWDINVYEYVYKSLVPEWGNIIKKKKGSVYALVVLNNSTGVSGSQIKSFNYDLLLRKIETPQELRKTDFSKYPLFGFLMCEVKESDLSSLYELLHSDLSEYIEV